MKTLKLCLSALLLFSVLAYLTSCKDDDNSTPGVSLEGTLWTEISNVSTGCDDPNENENETSTCTATDCSTVMLSGGILTSKDIQGGVTETTTGTYTILGNGKLKVTIDGFTQEVMYTISGNLLTVVIDSPFGGCTSTTVYTSN